MTDQKNTMNESDIKAARERCEAVGEAPWGYTDDGRIIAGPDSEMPFTVASGLKLKTHSKFIAHARTDLPRALDTIEALRDRVAELKGNVRALDGICLQVAELNGQAIRHIEAGRAKKAKATLQKALDVGCSSGNESALKADRDQWRERAEAAEAELARHRGCGEAPDKTAAYNHDGQETTHGE